MGKEISPISSIKKYAELLISMSTDFLSRGITEATYIQNISILNKQIAITRFCPESCGFLSPTEVQQLKGETHFCSKYKRQIKHLGNHPRLVRCEECKR